MNKCKNVSLTAARMTFRVQALNRAPCRSYRRIHPPLKNSIYTLGVKTTSKMSFLWSMESTKKVLLMEHGKHVFEFCNPSAMKRPLFLSIISAEGCQKWQNVIPTPHEKQQKICFLRSMGSIFSTFVTSLD